MKIHFAIALAGIACQDIFPRKETKPFPSLNPNDTQCSIPLCTLSNTIPISTMKQTLNRILRKTGSNLHECHLLNFEHFLPPDQTNSSEDLQHRSISRESIMNNRALAYFIASFSSYSEKILSSSKECHLHWNSLMKLIELVNIASENASKCKLGLFPQNVTDPHFFNPHLNPFLPKKYDPKVPLTDPHYGYSDPSHDIQRAEDQMNKYNPRYNFSDQLSSGYHPIWPRNYDFVHYNPYMRPNAHAVNVSNGGENQRHDDVISGDNPRTDSIGDIIAKIAKRS